ncbi:STAS domain-containing protein [Fictibacillus iocasae]|uniref:STAS domain-containing protein n=1 Tax=Fictibacillus iocasae TaxID=2715437 RepID=A0ABW2NL43_9BACL
MALSSNETALLQAEIEELKNNLKASERLIAEISVPVIHSILPETALVPITGMLYPERYEMITSKIVKLSSAENISTIIIDFSGIGSEEIGDIAHFGNGIKTLTDSLSLMGVQAIFTGFSAAVSIQLISSGLSEIQHIRTFSSFRNALKELMKEKKMQFQSH